MRRPSGHGTNKADLNNVIHDVLHCTACSGRPPRRRSDCYKWVPSETSSPSKVHLNTNLFDPLFLSQPSFRFRRAPTREGGIAYLPHLLSLPVKHDRRPPQILVRLAPGAHYNSTWSPVRTSNSLCTGARVSTTTSNVTPRSFENCKS